MIDSTAIMFLSELWSSASGTAGAQLASEPWKFVKVAAITRLHLLLTLARLGFSKVVFV